MTITEQNLPCNEVANGSPQKINNNNYNYKIIKEITLTRLLEDKGKWPKMVDWLNILHKLLQS